MFYADENKWEKARDFYQKAVREDASYRTLYNHPGPIFWDRGYVAEARASYEKMKKLDPAHPDYQLFDLKCCVRDKKWQAGVRLAKEMLLQDKDSFLLRLAQGECYFQLGQYREAWNSLQLHEDSFCEELKFPHFLWLKVRIASKLNQTDEAIRYYQKLNQFVLQDPRIQWGLARLYFKKRNFYKARRHAMKAFRQWVLEWKIR